jgi:hypothetical protein
VRSIAARYCRSYPRMKRLLRNVAAAASLLIFIFIVVVIVRSYFLGDVLTWDRRNDKVLQSTSVQTLQSVTACSSADRFAIQFDTATATYPYPFVGGWGGGGPLPPTTNTSDSGIEHQQSRDLTMDAMFMMFVQEPTISFAGFGFGSHVEDRDGYHARSVVLCAPGWFLAMLAAVLPARAVALRRGELRQRRMEGKMCVRCGYDLRGTPDRCPECGHVTENLVVIEVRQS